MAMAKKRPRPDPRERGPSLRVDIGTLRGHVSEHTALAVRTSRLPAPLRAIRPRQWLKNVLVAAAPLAAGQIFDAEV